MGSSLTIGVVLVGVRILLLVVVVVGRILGLWLTVVAVQGVHIGITSLESLKCKIETVSSIGKDMNLGIPGKSRGSVGC